MQVDNLQVKLRKDDFFKLKAGLITIFLEKFLFG